MTRAEDWARRRGVQLLVLNAHAENTAAQRFYAERLSYRPFGVILRKEDPNNGR